MSHRRTIELATLGVILLLAGVAAPGSAAKRPVAAAAAKNPAPRAKPATRAVAKSATIPPSGNDLPPGERAELEMDLAALGREIDSLRRDLKDKPNLLAFLPDVEIYHKAVRVPLVYHETIDFKQAKAALEAGRERAAQLGVGDPKWTHSSGPRAYVSEIDGSIQPYNLILPSAGAEAEGQAGRPRRLDIFCHGRDEKLTELKFISSKVGNAPPAGDKFVLLLYGRYCNANKFAGEVDCFEAMADVKKRHQIDENRVLMIGFSMGGAAAWHFAVHYADVWAAASPGAGFADTQRYQRLAEKGLLDAVPWFQKKLWHLYDCPDWAANLFNLPVIAYAGEIDPQKLASDDMAAAMKAEGLTLRRLIGPNTAHQYHKQTRQELDRQLDAILAKGRHPFPKQIRFTTWTLRYNRMFWLTVDGLGEHWARARADADVAENGVTIRTDNVSGLTIAYPPGKAPFAPGAAPNVVIDGASLKAPAVAADRSWKASFSKSGGAWKPGALGDTDPPGALRKRHGLQGPIDDAFMEPFMIVLPDGKSANAKVGAWTRAEADHAIDSWRKIFRGEPRVKQAGEVTADDDRSYNLVLFGDPSDNRILADVAPKLPIGWKADHVSVGDSAYPADDCVPVLVYPNPNSPGRYVVINSGFTFRDADHSSNARQVAKLPDWAIININTPRTPEAPCVIKAAGFFDESWRLRPSNAGGKKQ